MQSGRMNATDGGAGSDGSDPRWNASGRSRSVGDLCYDMLSRHALVFLLLLLSLVFLRAVAESHGKRLWYDEIFSVIVATQPTWHRFAQAMPADANPPIYALLTRLCIHIFGLTDLAVRVPSILSFLAVLTGVYIYVCRECGAVYGLLAVVLTFSQPGWTYSFEARPHMMMQAFMVLALVSWQSATHAAAATPPRPRRLALAGIAVGIAGGILAHNMGIVEIGVPLLFGEAVRLYRTRRPDWPVLATALAALPALAITWPMVRRTSELLLANSHSAMHPFTLSKVYGFCSINLKLTLHLILNSNLIELLAIIVLVTWVPLRLNRSRSGGPARAEAGASGAPPAHIVAAALGASLLIPVTMMVMMFSGWYYNCRYGIGCIAGTAMLASLLIGRSGRRQSAISITLVAFLAMIFAHAYITDLRHPPGQVDGIAPVISSDRSGLPIATSDPFTYVQTWWYASAPIKNRLVYLSDKPTAQRYGYLVPEVALVAEKSVTSMSIEDYTKFLSTHNHFLVDLTLNVPSVDMKDRLEDLNHAGYQTTLVRSDGFNSIYEVQRTVLPDIMIPVHATK